MNAATPTDLADFRALIARRLGLWFDDNRRDFLADLLHERAAGDPARFLQSLAGPGGRDEWAALAATLTVGETYFLRGGEHFRAFVETAWPELHRSAGARPLRLLSAGCASGEEAYSLVIALRERLGALDSRAVAILGVDVNRDALAKARAGRYSAWSLRETPPEIRDKYFHAARPEFVLDPTVCALVAFEERNLAEAHDDLWSPGTFDAVFCRNMLMYFTPEAAAALVARLTRALVPGGFLFLGHAETLRGLSQAFHLRRSHGAFYYQLREGAAQPPPARERPESFAFPPPLAPPAEAAAAVNPGWFEEIGRASARIASLAAGAPRAAARAAPARPGDLSRVLDLHRQERFADALAHLQGLPAGAAPDADLQVLQAVLLVHCGRLAEAEALCRPLLGRDELNAGAHHVAALCREHAGDLAAAEEHDAAAAYLDPAFAMPRFHLGRLCQRAGRAADALAHFEAALALLVKEDPVRLLLFGGGFSRETLMQACRSELHRLRRSAPP